MVIFRVSGKIRGVWESTLYIKFLNCSIGALKNQLSLTKNYCNLNVVLHRPSPSPVGTIPVYATFPGAQCAAVSFMAMMWRPQCSTVLHNTGAGRKTLKSGSILFCYQRASLQKGGGQRPWEIALVYFSTFWSRLRSVIVEVNLVVIIFLWIQI